MGDLKNPLSEDIYRHRQRPRQEDIRGPYFRDQTAIIHSMPFRRLKHKTQVFFSPENDHICTRMEHTLHVATISAAICRALGLDSDLAQAIALGHDLGHAPFGHKGEEVLDRLLKDYGGFIHEIYALRVVDHLANDGAGLNLTYGVRDGIVCHCGERYEKQIRPRTEPLALEEMKRLGYLPATYEGCVVRVSDKISYLGRDIEDAYRAGLVDEGQVPQKVLDKLGRKNGEIIDTLVSDVIANARESGLISFSDECHELMCLLYDFNMTHIYRSPPLVEYGDFCEKILCTLFQELGEIYGRYGRDYTRYHHHPVPLFRRFGRHLQKMEYIYQRDRAPVAIMVGDYLAGMSDEYALKCIKEVFLPEPLPFDLPRGAGFD